MNRWAKLGRISAPGDVLCGSAYYGTLPTPLVDAEKGLIRVYLGLMHQGRGRIGYLDLSRSNPLEVLGWSEVPVLELGEAGMFDDNGVAPACAVARGSEVWLYYIGYQLHRRVRFTIFTGLAISRDGGNSFERASRVPLLDRTDDELFFRSTPFVARDHDAWRMWYSGGGRWRVVAGKEVPLSEIREAFSDDGRTWKASAVPCVRLTPDGNAEALVRPWVLHSADRHTMYYSVRSGEGYRLECVQSTNGRDWLAARPLKGLEPSTSGWDSRSISYASIAQVDDATYLFYSGNDFGAAGFGVAALDSRA